MTVDIGHLVEVSFDGVGGAALIAFISALYERRRKAKSENTTKAPAAVGDGRLKTWISVAGVVFVASLGAGVIFHFAFRTPVQSVSNRGIEPSISPIHAELLTQTPRNEPLGEPHSKNVARGETHPKNEPPLKRVATTKDEVIALVADHLQVDRAKVKPENDFVLDLGATPLDVTEIVLALETSYDIQIPDKEARKFKSVGDMIDYMERRENTGKTP
jgi:acyl carrier protein